MNRFQLQNRIHLPWPPPVPPVVGSQQQYQPYFAPANMNRTNRFQKPHRSNKPRRVFSHKKKPGKKPRGNYRFTPFTPYNTTSFLIRAKKSGGIASLVSPCSATPAVLPTPEFSPAKDAVSDVAKEEWGVNGYGSMNGLIRLRSPENEPEGGGVIDLNRFEMIYDPTRDGFDRNYSYVFDYGVDEHVEKLEEENMVLKERVFVIERELVELRKRVRYLEGSYQNEVASCKNNSTANEEDDDDDESSC